MNFYISLILCSIIVYMVGADGCSKRFGHEYIPVDISIDKIRRDLISIDTLNYDYLFSLLSEPLTPESRIEIHVLIDNLPMEHGNHLLLKVLRSYYAVVDGKLRGLPKDYLQIAQHLIQHGYNLFEDIAVLRLLEEYKDEKLFNVLLRTDFKRMLCNSDVQQMRKEMAEKFDDFTITMVNRYIKFDPFRQYVKPIFESVKSAY